MEETTKQTNQETNGTIEAITENNVRTVEELETLLVVEQKKAAELADNWKRSLADFQNLKRRTEIERANINADVKSRVIMRLLPIVDDFERALASTPDNLKAEPWVNGVSLIEKKLKTLLEQEGISSFDAKNADFDPRYHDAVQRDEDGEGDKDIVTEVYQKGYMMGDRVLRPAAVKVGRG
ncbi:nucleotide exchange factor GrpE [Candidatus Chlorohelix sp.]|uniref:nucleotide exchange factor GrpE n=1 Tax=Candidatus Chlorohelix sp. TaxID=3139201 RepID=UPI00304C786E